MDSKNFITKDVAKNIELRDGDGEFGGVSFRGETLDDFLTEQEASGNKGYKWTIDEINEALRQCGIAEIVFKYLPICQQPKK